MALKQVEIDKIKPNPWNPNRMDKETFESLKESIRHSNLLEENPILVRESGDGYEIVDGEERWSVAKKLGYKTIPIKIETLDDFEAKRRTVILNKDRGTIDYFPLGKIFYELSRNGGGNLIIKEIGLQFGGYAEPRVSEITSVYVRLKDMRNFDPTNFSNRTKIFIARVERNDFRQLLLDACKSEEFPLDSLPTKASLLNQIWAYIQSKTEDEQIIQQIIEEIKPNLLKASLSTLKNSVDVLIESLVERNIIHGDALVEMPKLDAEQFACVIADPPYLVSTRGGDITFKKRKDMKRDLAEWDYTDKREFLDWCKKWIVESHRVLNEKGTIYVFTSDRFISHIIDTLQEAGFTPKTTVVWHKPNPEPMVRKRDYCSSTEYIVFAVKGEDFTFNWKGQNEMHNFVELPICMGDERTVHPTQKPVTLIKHLIEVSTNTKDRVLDPFAGSGTTAVACEELKRHWTMIEIEKEYVDIIKRRVLKD